jgi:tryptophanyl-tRNA synthetase
MTATTRTRTRRLTGLKPTGHLQLGNLLGALAPMCADQHATESTLMIADLHALTVDHRPHEVRALSRELATVALAAGIDPDRTTLYVQSHVPEHTELHYLLECVTGHGEAQRMIQFKERAAGQRHTRLSLLTYPVLMAADILVHDTETVPVGADQAQHLELARSIATRFNARYGETFTVPRAVLPDGAARVMDLADPTAKMAKSGRSAAGVLHLLDPPDVVRHKVGLAVTDSHERVRYDPARQPGVANLLAILAATIGPTGSAPADLAAAFDSYRQLKAAVTEAVIARLVPIQHRYAELAADPEVVTRVLRTGAARARKRAAGTVARARRAIGLLTA